MSSTRAISDWFGMPSHFPGVATFLRFVTHLASLLSRRPSSPTTQSRLVETERRPETARIQILEQALANQPLGLVLDQVAKYVCDALPGHGCAVLVSRPSRWDIAATAGIPGEWLMALRKPGILPPEVWRRPTSQSDAMLWRAFCDLVPEAPREGFVSCVIGQGGLRMGALLVCATGPTVPCLPETDEALRIAAQLAFVAIEHRQVFDDLNWRAHHDALTGLPNRVLFDERLRSAVQEAEATRAPMAVISIDLDRFRRINDSMGPLAGDVVLSDIAARIRRAVRAADTVSRTGGDEFVVIAGGLAEAWDLEDLCERILCAIREPILVNGKAISITASIGSARFPEDGRDPDWLRRKADAAMVCARNLGRNRAQSFADSGETMQRVRLEEDLREALESNSLEVHYQPKVAAGGSFQGLEALVRLKTPERGYVPPAEFIPVAEEGGLISQLGMWVLSEVCRQVREWHAMGLGWIPVAVNVSPLQISNPGFAKEVKKCLHSYGVPPSSVELEITESVLLGAGKEGERQMRELEQIGIRFSIDDFGTGYSSLSYLYLLPVHAIKLDRSFVQAMGKEDGARRLVQAMIGVAEGLGLDVVAEGVETQEQLRLLIADGCPVMQGYLFARPAPAHEIERFIHAPRPPQPDIVRGTQGDLFSIAQAVEEARLQQV